MYASHPTQRRHPSQRAGGLYQQVGVETAVDAATPHQLVALLFDGLLEALAQARGAMHAGQTEAKAQAVSRAMGILVEGLRGGLDLQAGGSLARDLDELYGYLSMRLTLANLRNDDAALQECQRLVQPLREAWTAIGGPDAATAPARRA
jgi:flagellar protein FliS